MKPTLSGLRGRRRKVQVRQASGQDSARRPLCKLCSVPSWKGRVLSHLEAAAWNLRPLPWADPAIPPRAPHSGHRGRQRASAVAGPTAHRASQPRGALAGRRPPGLPASLPPASPPPGPGQAGRRRRIHARGNLRPPEQELLEGGEQEVIDGAEVLAALVQAELQEDQLPLLHVPGPAHDQGGFLRRHRGQRLSPSAVGRSPPSDPCGPQGGPATPSCSGSPSRATRAAFDLSSVALLVGWLRCRISLLKNINSHLFSAQIFSSSQSGSH